MTRGWALAVLMVALMAGCAVIYEPSCRLQCGGSATDAVAALPGGSK